jgi:hypothetical protein
VPFREAAASPQGDEALIKGTKALALTGFELLTDHQTLSAIKEEFLDRKLEQEG